MKLILIFKGGAGSGHHGHAGRPGKHGGSLPGRYSALTTKVVWNEYGESYVMRGGVLPKNGPIFLSADSEIAIDYAGQGKDKRALGLYKITDTSKVLTVGSDRYYDVFGYDAGEEYESEAQQLYSDPPDSFMETLHGAGYVGYASSGGRIIRIEEDGYDLIETVHVR